MSRNLPFLPKTIRLWSRLNTPKKSTQQSIDFLYTPLIAIILFMATMFLILWILNNQEKDQADLALFREVAYAEQRIQVNFEENEEEFQIFSKSSNSQEKKTARQYDQRLNEQLNRHPEILQIQLISANQSKTVAMPVITDNDWALETNNLIELNANLQNTLKDAITSSRSIYGPLIQLNPKSKNENANRERAIVFWYVQPTTKYSGADQHIAVLYSLPKLINRIIPKELQNRHRFSIINDKGQVLYSVNQRSLAKEHAIHQIKLSKLPDNLILQGESYPIPNNLTYAMLLWLVVGLSSYVIWSFWSIWWQMKKRQDIERNLIKETNFRLAIEESMPVGLRVHDLDGKINYVNPAFCKMVGWTAPELIGRMPPFPFWSSDEEISANSSKLETAFNSTSGLPETIEATITTKEGKKIAVRNFVSPLLDARNQQTGWITSLIDISEPRKIREELAASQQRFVTVLEGLTAAISVVNPKTGELLFTNDLYREMFDNTSQAHQLLLGDEAMSSSNIDSEDDSVDGFAGLPSSVLTPIIGDSREVQIIDKPNWYEVRRRYIPWTNGHLAQLLITIDITDRRATEDRLRTQEERIQFSSRLTTMGEMASSIAHELNQPLAAINNYCMGAISRLKNRHDLQLTEEILPAIEKASAQALRAGTIIKRIRNFVKRSAPQRQSCKIHQIIEQSIELADIEAKRQGLLIELIITPNLPECFVDPILIEQVLINLLKNSIDSMRIAIPRHSRGIAKPIQLKADIDFDQSSPMLRIKIIDSGEGIPAQSMSQIYEPFFSTKYEGMGMGLNICRSIIESHQGRLWGENNLPKIGQLAITPKNLGCTFTILLPIEHVELLPSSVDQLPEISSQNSA